MVSSGGPDGSVSLLHLPVSVNVGAGVVVGDGYKNVASSTGRCTFVRLFVRQ